MQKLCTFSNFSSKLDNKILVFIGAGKRAVSFVKQYGWYPAYCIDNNPEKKGSFLETEKGCIPVHDWKYLLDNVSLDTVLMITPVDFSALQKQIESEDALRDIDYYIPYYMSCLQWDADRIAVSNVPYTITKGTVQKIPKIIHYFWFSGDPYPEKVQKCIDSWHKFCPDYEFKKWDLTNYTTGNKFVEDALKNRDWAHASDYGRCDVVYRYGGIYLDSDVELVKPLDDLLYDTGFFCFESAGAVDPGSGFGAVAKNPVIKEICETYDNILYVKKTDEKIWNPVNILKIYTDVLVSRGLVLNGQYQNIEGFAVYPPLVLSPYSHQTGILTMHEKTYGIHHWVSNWITDKQMDEMNGRKAYIQKCLNADDVWRG